MLQNPYYRDITFLRVETAPDPFSLGGSICIEKSG